MVDPSSGDAQDVDVTGMVNAVGDEAPRVHHIRDDEAIISRLSPCVLLPFERRQATRCALAIYPAAIWLPDAAAAERMEVPDDGRWDGWQWARYEFLLLHMDADPLLPSLAFITDPRPGYCRMDVLGRPMRVWRVAPGEQGWKAPAYAAEVHGFLDERTQFWGQAVAPSVERRERLLAAIGTLERTSTA